MASADQHNIDITRIEAMKAPKDRESWKNVSQFWFSACHGRRILPGEYGCYQSHLQALEQIVSQELEYAIICEDDVVFNSEFIQDCDEIFKSHPDLDVLKLMNHRCHGFREIARTASNKEVGYALFGPLGSAATYAVSAKGAKKLLAALKLMTLPYDNALERGWAHGFEIFCVKDNWLDFSEENQTSQITSDYKDSKYPFLLRTPTLFFRIKDIVSRLIYVLKLKIKYR